MSAVRLSTHRALYAVVGFYVVIRVIDAVLIVLAAGQGQHHDSPWAVYQRTTTNWDGGWYERIVREGYPDSALDADGRPTETALAFYPLFPLASRALGAVTGLPFSVTGPTLSIVAGAVATALVFVLMKQSVGATRAALACCVVTTSVAAPVFQLAYTESLALALVATVLLLVRQRRYVWAVLPVLALGLTRNIALVLAAVVVAHWAVGWRAHRRGTGPAPGHLGLAVLLVSTGVAAVLWPAIVGLLTGDPRAYATTLKAWPGFSPSLLRPAWVAAVDSTGPTSLALAAILLVGFVVLMCLPVTRAWGVELWSWSLAYPVYIFLAASFSTSVLRYLLLAFPLALVLVPAARTSRDRIARVVMVVVWVLLGLAAQWVWISHVLIFHDQAQNWGPP